MLVSHGSSCILTACFQETTVVEFSLNPAQWFLLPVERLASTLLRRGGSVAGTAATLDRLRMTIQLR